MRSCRLENTYTPGFTTETNEPSPWLDCTWAAGLMLANKASNGKYPNTKAERKALRKASGDKAGGSTLQDLSKGIRLKYKWLLRTTIISIASLELRLRRGDAAVAGGLYSTFQKTNFARWDRKFAAQGDDSRHLVAVQGHDPKGYQHLEDDEDKLAEVYWRDPLGRGNYKGEWMPWSLFEEFVTSFGWVHSATKEAGSIK